MVLQNFSVILCCFEPVLGNGTVDMEGVDLNLLLPLNKVWLSFCEVS
jgi:hypothetical protein